MQDHRISRLGRLRHRPVSAETSGSARSESGGTALAAPALRRSDRRRRACGLRPDDPLRPRRAGHRAVHRPAGLHDVTVLQSLAFDNRNRHLYTWQP